MRRWVVAALLACFPAACVLQTETIDRQPGIAGPPGEAGVSPFVTGPDGSISYTDGRVGIGTPTPSRLLDVTEDQDGHARVGFLNRSNGASAAEIVEIGAGDGEYDCVLQLGKFASGNTEVAYEPPMSLANFASVTTNCKNDAGLIVGTGLGTVGSPIVFVTSGTPKATIDAAGNVGIGTTTPKARQHVVGDLILGLDINDRKFVFTPRDKFSGEFLQITADGPDGNWQFNHGITVHRGGNIGVGTTSPMATLDVNGTARLAKYSSPPLACDSDHDGTIALTSKNMTCVCDGAGWVRTADGTSPCTW